MFNFEGKLWVMERREWTVPQTKSKFNSLKDNQQQNYPTKITDIQRHDSRESTEHAARLRAILTGCKKARRPDSAPQLKEWRERWQRRYFSTFLEHRRHRKHTCWQNGATQPSPGDLQRLCQQRPSVLQGEHWTWKQRTGKERGLRKVVNWTSKELTTPFQTP